jgi:DNA-binding MarR family transcriptional regulator
MTELSDIAAEVTLIAPRISRKILSDVFQSFDISHAQLCVISTLIHHGPMHTADIVRELNVAAPTASGIIGRLEKAGYVKRSPDPVDRRAVIVELTPQGTAMAETLRTTVARRWQSLLEKIPREDAEKYVEILRKIKEAL